MTEKLGKILYAENDQMLRTVCLMLFERTFPDYEIESLKDGTSLERKLNDGIENVKLVLTDNNMPGINGSDIIRNYAQKPGFENLPFIIFYGGDESIGRELVERYGAFAYMTKPGNPRNLLAKIKEALNYSESIKLSQ